MFAKYSKRADAIDVAYVARLARLELSEDEIDRFRPQLQQILGYVRQLGELDVEHIEPTAHAIPLENVFRNDERKPCLAHERVMDNAPAHRDGLFSVPRIIEP